MVAGARCPASPGSQDRGGGAGDRHNGPPGCPDSPPRIHGCRRLCGWGAPSYCPSNSREGDLFLDARRRGPPAPLTRATAPSHAEAVLSSHYPPPREGARRGGSGAIARTPPALAPGGPGTCSGRPAGLSPPRASGQACGRARPAPRPARGRGSAWGHPESGRPRRPAGRPAGAAAGRRNDGQPERGLRPRGGGPRRAAVRRGGVASALRFILLSRRLPVVGAGRNLPSLPPRRNQGEGRGGRGHPRDEHSGRSEGVSRLHGTFPSTTPQPWRWGATGRPAEPPSGASCGSSPERRSAQEAFREPCSRV